MLKRVIRRSIRKFGRRYDYGVDYLEHMLEIDPAACLKLSRIMGVSSYRVGIPAEPWYAAKIRTVLTEDCGPCTQLAVNMALEDGVAPAHIRAIVERDFDALPAETVLAIRFTELALAHDPMADDLRDEIVDHWGEAAVVSLALVISSTRLYPTMKYVLGYGKACSKVAIDRQTVPAIRGRVAGAAA